MNLEKILSFVTNYEGEQNGQVSIDDITILYSLASVALLQAEYLFVSTMASRNDAEEHAMASQDQFLAAFPSPRWSERAERLRYLATRQ